MNSIRIEDWKTSNLQIIIYQSLDLNIYWFTTSARTTIYLVNNRTNSWHMATGKAGIQVQSEPQC